MKIIGITGGIGAGKSTVCSEFQKYGAKIIDADKISRQITSKNGDAYHDIVDFYGNSILSDNGEINRRKLGEIVFADKDKLTVLNKITHKYIFEQMKVEISNAESDIVILDVPLLFDSEIDIKCDMTIAVIADIECRILRVMKRDNIDKESVLQRINAQLSNEELRKRADICIDNNDLDDMKRQVEDIVNAIRGKEK